jgi:hypothetical protein
MSLFAELQRRNVIRVSVAYVIAVIPFVNRSEAAEYLNVGLAE